MAESQGDLQVEGNQTGVTQDWRSGVAEENRSGVAKFGTANDLAKSYLELEKTMGGRVKIPTEESTSEEISTFYTKLGRPDTSDGYNRPKLEEGKNFNENLIGGMQTAAFEENITNKQFTKLVERYLSIEKQTAEAAEAEGVRAREETDRTLREQWGGEYEKNVEVARRAMRELVPDELGEQFKVLIEESGLGNNLVFIQGFREIGSKMLDDTLVRGDGQVKVEENYAPTHPNSPDMYKNGEDEESKKARAWFVKKGHVY